MAFLTVLILAVILGSALGSVFGGIAGLVCGIIVFFCGLGPAAEISFIHGEVRYAQDRADRRAYRRERHERALAEEREYLEDLRAEEREYLEDLRAEREWKRFTLNDNRQVHYHGKGPHER
jgi:hypothetical protein